MKIEELMPPALWKLLAGHEDPAAVLDLSFDLLAAADEGGPGSLVEAVKQVLHFEAAIKKSCGFISKAGHV